MYISFYALAINTVCKGNVNVLSAMQQSTFIPIIVHTAFAFLRYFLTVYIDKVVMCICLFHFTFDNL
ncbi:hypothetical protein SDC9_145880 [bioreactor metagenome]|uniref:Uncharacterized protein n=1 Tax=bioreactor metagenome TaxID=1076179 RepID=A0A645EDM6_9ZZZZ